MSSELQVHYSDEMLRAMRGHPMMLRLGRAAHELREHDVTLLAEFTSLLFAISDLSGEG